MKNKMRYDVDVSIAKARGFLKRKLPGKIQEKIDNRKRKSSSVFFEQLLFQNNPPWSSPNIWQTIVDHYYGINKPVLFEYGTGSSSLWHFENLLSGGGEYFGVEIDYEWFWVVISAMLKKATDHSINSTLTVEPAKDSNAINAYIKTDNANATIMFRDNEVDYVKALSTKCDVVIIDGAHRKPCVDHVLDSKFLADKGLLMLMEAGRGSDKWWQGKLYDQKDYSQELHRMLSLGGEILDGDGIDSWPNTNRRSVKPVSYYYPMEACKLIIDRKIE